MILYIFAASNGDGSMGITYSTEKDLIEKLYELCDNDMGYPYDPYEEYGGDAEYSGKITFPDGTTEEDLKAMGVSLTTHQDHLDECD